ncbi:MAG: Slp family lipoprotein [Nitrospirae bacterium]|nr:Slp family lipoprotein [Nitrospirota bacterium]
MRWFSVTVGCMVTVGLSACATAIPSKFVSQAEPGVTLTALKNRPEAYKGKVVILGGVIVDKREEEGRVWLLVKNRPLDADYVPHVPVSREGPEASHYWVMVTSQGLPKTYRNWARMTVVGRVSDHRAAGLDSATETDTVLVALYLRGWGSGWGGYGLHEETWEEIQSPNAILSTPLRVKP